MHTQWIVLANRSQAKIFEITPDKHPRFLKEIPNPRGRTESARNINSDKAGRNANFGTRGFTASLEKRETPVEHDSNIFASKLGQEIDKARHLSRFAELSLVAEPHLLGKIKHALSKATQKTLRTTIKKDIVEQRNQLISEFLSKQSVLKPKIDTQDDSIAPRKREQWAKEIVETRNGKLGRSLEGGGSAKRNKASKNTKRGQRAAALVRQSRANH